MHADEVEIAVFIGIADKSDRFVGRVSRTAEHLGNGYAGRLDAINHHFGIGIAACVLVDGLGGNAQAEQSDTGNEGIDDGNRGVERLYVCDSQYDIVDDEIAGDRREYGQQHLDGVNECGVAQDTCVGVEHPKHNGLHAQHHQHLPPYRQYVCGVRIGK